MKFPCLVQKRFCTTDIRVRAESEERNVYGEPSVHEYAGKCNWQNKGKVVFTADKIAVNITGTAYFTELVLLISKVLEAARTIRNKIMNTDVPKVDNKDIVSYIVADKKDNTSTVEEATRVEK